MTPWLEGWRGGLLLCAFALAAWGALGFAGFVWDDEALVVGNRYTGELSNLPKLFTLDLWETSELGETSGYYRPLMLLSLALDRALWGLSPAGAHLHSLGWHLAASLLLLGLLRSLVPPLPAWLGAAMFALHPAQSEAVAWVVARNDLMAAAFVFASIRALLPAAVSPVRLLAGGLAMVAALLSKESAVLAVVLLGLLDLARWGRPKGYARYAALLGAVGGVVGLRAAVGIQATAFPMEAGRQLLLERAPDVAALYGRRLLWPWPLSVGETLEYLAVPPLEVALWLSGVAALVAVTLLRGKRLALAGWLFAGAAFAPSLLAVAIRGQLGERYLYLPLAGIAVAVAASVPARRASLVVGGVVVAAWMTALNLRLPEWRSGQTLFAAAVEDSPNGFTFAELGHELNREEATRDEAVEWFMRALADDPPYADVCPNVIRQPLGRGQVERAWANAQYARERGCPATPTFRGLYASAAAQNGAWDGAREALDGQACDALDGRGLVVAAALARIDGDDIGDDIGIESLAACAGVSSVELASQSEKLLMVSEGQR